MARTTTAKTTAKTTTRTARTSTRKARATQAAAADGGACLPGVDQSAGFCLQTTDPNTGLYPPNAGRPADQAAFCPDRPNPVQAAPGAADLQTGSGSGKDLMAIRRHPLHYENDMYGPDDFWPDTFCPDEYQEPLWRTPIRPAGERPEEPRDFDEAGYAGPDDPRWHDRPYRDDTEEPEYRDWLRHNGQPDPSAGPGSGPGIGPEPGWTPGPGNDRPDEGNDTGPRLCFPEPLVHELACEQLERLLLWCVGQHASDIVFCPGDPVWMQCDGVWHAVTDSVLTDAETQLVVNESSGQPNRAGLVRTGRSLDYAWAVRIPGQRRLRQRFRVNATATNKGLYVVLRVLPRSLPCLDDMEGLDENLVRELFPGAGLVVVSGVMGSGKSTLLAAILHEAVRSRAIGRQILTLEDPIEFDFSSLPATTRVAPIAQSAVHLDVENWVAGVRTLTRRKGEIVMVGECRDKETLAALLTTVEQGVTAYTTVHAQDVPQTLTRMINAFPEEERAAVAAVLKANLRVLIHQRLVPRQRSAAEIRAGVPGRIALREYLVIDEALRRHLYTVPLERLIPTVRELVSTRGRSLLDDALARHREGRISEDVLAAIRHEQECTGSSNGLGPGRPEGGQTLDPALAQSALSAGETALRDRQEAADGTGNGSVPADWTPQAAGWAAGGKPARQMSGQMSGARPDRACGKAAGIPCPQDLLTLMPHD